MFEYALLLIIGIMLTHAVVTLLKVTSNKSGITLQIRIFLKSPDKRIAYKFVMKSDFIL
ncbi:hypothetical protein BCL52_2177 [Salisediminibacterium halotolerans]|nr:hypothetical protein BCL39_2182 [Actinophytocola xinjiangensis]RPE85497.1 hypothetical protein EDD67_2317 [Salisediminibacterium halotolerans]TWG33452.1 hypothetical protein BCL52_2177 [Salisediminibacterium halotolerans]GEL07063.1 hypothetical protein SHA02_04790 [Salisediminibacterium halotolerans]